MNLKFGVVDLITGWGQSPYDSIFYDSKFVHILVAHVIGNDDFMKNQFNKKKMQFIKSKMRWYILFKKIQIWVFFIHSSNTFLFFFSDAFTIRVGNDAQRLMRFSGYLEKRKKTLALQLKFCLS